MKKFTIFLFLSLSLFPQVNTFRLWNYFNFTLPIKNNLSWIILPGLRYEVFREEGEAKGLYMFEFFTGFSYSTSIKGINLRFPLYYYNITFLETNNKYFVHSIDFLPNSIQRIGNFIITERMIFHNRLYSNFYDDKFGYSLLIRGLLQVKYAFGKYLLGIGIEPFVGIIEDKSHNPSPIGFTPNGLNLNRVYFGLDYPLLKNFSISLNYVYETTYSGGDLTGKNHYIFIMCNILKSK